MDQPDDAEYGFVPLPLTSNLAQVIHQLNQLTEQMVELQNDNLRLERIVAEFGSRGYRLVGPSDAVPQAVPQAEEQIWLQQVKVGCSRALLQCLPPLPLHASDGTSTHRVSRWPPRTR